MRAMENPTLRYERSKAATIFEVTCLGRYDFAVMSQAVCGCYADPKAAWAKRTLLSLRFPSLRFTVFPRRVVRSPYG